LSKASQPIRKSQGQIKLRTMQQANHRNNRRAPIATEYRRDTARLSFPDYIGSQHQEENYSLANVYELACFHPMNSTFRRTKD
ncbi:MAG: hypothetical protein L0213_07400, partial [Candidatus Dadabacteria bacterium]|nr:hypothetical protein [Candidatus Dadabacteria bacterium]